MAVGGQQQQLAQQQEQQSASLFNTAFPGFQTAESYYQALASGDPSKIFQAVAPAIQQISQNTAGEKEQIRQNMPRGGQENLALSEADISKTAQIGGLEQTAYTGSFPALASMGSTGIGLSNNEIANAISAFSGASTTYANVAEQQAQGKGASKGFMGDVAQAGGEIGAAALLA
jgi:hypothetical protein